LLERFGMSECNPVLTPLDPNQHLDEGTLPKTTLERKEMQKVPYRELLGSLIFAFQGTRPDIGSAITSLARFAENPAKVHWIALKRVLRYLKRTINYKLRFSRNENSGLLGFCDADWAGDAISRRSTTGYVFTLQGGAVSWASKKQTTVALSSTEAEYIAVAAACQEAVWLRQLLKDINPTSSTETTVLHCDNQSTIKLAHSSAYHARSKHIDTKLHFIREKILGKEIKLEFLCSKEMPADYLTKGVFNQKNILCNSKIGISE